MYLTYEYFSLLYNNTFVLFIYFFSFFNIYIKNIKMNPPQVYMCSPS